MNRQLTETHFLAGDVTSGHADRGVFDRRQRTLPRAPTGPPSATAADPLTAGANTPAPAGGRGPLRRWSIAELIARAVAAPRRTA